MFAIDERVDVCTCAGGEPAVVVEGGLAGVVGRDWLKDEREGVYEEPDALVILCVGEESDPADPEDGGGAKRPGES